MLSTADSHRLFCDLCGHYETVRDVLLKAAKEPPACPLCGSTVWREGGTPDPANQGVIRGSVVVEWPSVKVERL